MCGGRSRHATLLGQAQADAAAAGAAGVARLLIEGDVAEPGAWMPEQIVDPGPFLSRLATQRLKVEFPDGASLGVRADIIDPSAPTQSNCKPRRIGARPHHSTDAAHARRRGNRMNGGMSAIDAVDGSSTGT